LILGAITILLILFICYIVFSTEKKMEVALENEAKLNSIIYKLIYRVFIVGILTLFGFILNGLYTDNMYDAYIKVIFVTAGMVLFLSFSHVALISIFFNKSNKYR